MSSIEMNWLSTEDMIGFLHLSDFESIKCEWRQLVPRSFLGLGSLINYTLGTLPLIRQMSLRNYLVARPMRNIEMNNPSTSILIPCRN